MNFINKIRRSFQRFQDHFITNIVDSRSKNHQYKKLKYLGQDSSGTSFLVSSEKTGKLYTCKRLEKDAKQSGIFFNKSLRSEFCITSSLNHKNIVQFYDLIKYNNRWFELTEYSDKGRLYDKCRKGLDIHEIELYFKQLINGVEYLHKKGIAHRNINLETLIIDNEGAIKISNFSFADVFKILHDYEKRNSQGLFGKDPYVAPEIYTDECYDGEAADIWSCGIILHAMLFKHFPFKKSVTSDVSYTKFLNNIKCEGSYISRLPFDIHCAIVGMLEPDPKKRIRICKLKNNKWFKNIIEPNENQEKLDSKQEDLKF